MKSLEYQCLDFWRSKPADEEYSPGDEANCALGQFVAAMGGEGGWITWFDAGGNEHRYSDLLFEAALLPGHPYTFGNAADRLQKLLSNG